LSLRPPWRLWVVGCGPWAVEAVEAGEAERAMLRSPGEAVALLIHIAW